MKLALHLLGICANIAFKIKTMRPDYRQVSEAKSLVFRLII